MHGTILCIVGNLQLIWGRPCKLRGLPYKLWVIPYRLQGLPYRLWVIPYKLQGLPRKLRGMHKTIPHTV
ncbi:MAG: hypothetical protein LBL07_06920 [Tannerella sp.]|nr:hypothetical protein [Tannerella sp.]